MSKNIVIQEGGVGKQLTADKLQTNLVGGGTCLWVPEDERQLGTKYISENGTYRASADGYYGYSEVTVSGVGEVVGKDPDGSGDDAAASVDPETGEIVITKLPESINVVTPPSKTNYSDKEAINFTGMVVKAYLKNGSEWSDSGHPGGVIPTSELTLPVTIADAGSASGSGSASSSDYPGVTISVGGPVLDQITSGNKAIGAGVSFRKGNILYFVSRSSFDMFYYLAASETMAKQGSAQYGSDYGGYYLFSWVYTPNLWSPYLEDSTPSLSTCIDIILNGTIEGMGQTIPVEWNRPKDGNTLSSSFTITVNSSYGGATGGGGEAGETGAGRND